MSDAINDLKYEHEYHQFLKITFARLHDVNKNSFFLFGGRMECCMIYNKWMCGCQPFSQRNNHTLHKLQQAETNDKKPHSFLTFWSFQML